MELIQIVDENGEFTGEIIDKEIAHDKNLLHIEISVFIINDKNQVLLQKRSPNKRFSPNKWGSCAGHVDAYESLEDAALRELKEEVGLEIPKESLYPFLERQIFKKETNSHITYLYYTKCNKEEKEFIIQEEELSEVKWFDIDEIIRLIKANDDTITFRKDRLYIFEELKKLC